MLLASQNHLGEDPSGEINEIREKLSGRTINPLINGLREWIADHNANAILDWAFIGIIWRAKDVT